MNVSQLLASDHERSPSVEPSFFEDAFESPEVAMQLDGHGSLSAGPSEQLAALYLPQILDMEHDEDAEGEPDLDLDEGEEEQVVPLAGPSLVRNGVSFCKSATETYV